jgi:hypothetical protein
LPAENETQPGIGKIKPRVLRWSREPGTRVQVVGIWVFVAVVCAISKGPYSGRVFEIVSASCLAFFLFPFIEGPFRLHSRGMLPLRAEYHVVEGLQDSSIESYRNEHLLKMGFQFAGELVQPADPRNLAVRLAIFRHEENKDTAQVAQIIGGLRTLPVMGFRTDFQDGFAFETNDARGARLFPPDPECAIFRFPNVRSMPDLYRLHCKIKERYVDAHHPVLADKDRELARVIARSEVAHQRLAKFGDYHLAPFGEFYRLTWRGAIRQSWLNAWPVKQFRALRAESRALKMAEDMGMPINLKLGCLQDSLRPRRETSGLPGARRRT